MKMLLIQQFINKSICVYISRDQITCRPMHCVPTRSGSDFRVCCRGGGYLCLYHVMSNAPKRRSLIRNRKRNMIPEVYHAYDRASSETVGILVFCSRAPCINSLKFPILRRISRMKIHHNYNLYLFVYS